MAEKLSREAFARKEIGNTKVSKGMSLIISGIFLFTIFLVPFIQHGILQKGQGPAVTVEKGGAHVGIFQLIKAVNVSVLKAIHDLESELEEESFLRAFFLPPLQSFFYNVLGEGNEKVVAGKEGWLFYRPGVDSVTGAPFLDKEYQQMRLEGHEQWESPVQPDPVKAISQFKKQLAVRGIDLLVVPVPVKPSIQPEKLTNGPFTFAPSNRDWQQFLKRMDEEGVAVVDLTGLLRSYSKENGSAFLTTDTHWLPGAMDQVARFLADKIRVRFPDMTEQEEFLLLQQSMSAEGDIAKMLVTDSGREQFFESVNVEQVVNANNELWQPVNSSEILLLGDSFTNIYSSPSLGWGQSAGFAEKLSYHLQQSVDLLARNDSGAFVTREMLATELARGRDRLAGKKLVVWEFAARELSVGDWKMIDLILGSPGESSFLMVDAGESMVVEATVASLSKSPKPGSVPYRDNIITLHLVDIKGEDGFMENDQALVYALGMKDNALTEMANLRPGDNVRVRLSSWDDVEGEYGSYRRSPLDDEMMELELPTWGVLQQ